VIPLMEQVVGGGRLRKMGRIEGVAREKAGKKKAPPLSMGGLSLEGSAEGGK